jgi:hypothetical protein
MKPEAFILWQLRAQETSSRRISAGMAVMRLQDQESKKRAVATVAKRIGKSERYVWGSVKLARREHALTLKFLETLEKQLLARGHPDHKA